MNYIGSGPYCYANSLAMVMGSDAPDPSAIEVLTGSPFGVNLVRRTTPFFDPRGWDPLKGIDAALRFLGWTCEPWSGGTAAQAIDSLRHACQKGPVLAGPLEIGLLLHHPGSGRAIGSDHYVVVLAVDENDVQMHDPHGFPYATLPIDDFVRAWQGDSIDYSTAPFEMRYGFRQIRKTTVTQALRESIPTAARWLAVESDGDDVAGEQAVTALADQIDSGLESHQRAHLVYFAVRVGARRLADAARWLREIELAKASDIADTQAQLLGSLQHALVAKDTDRASYVLRRLAPYYTELRRELEQSGGCN